MSDLRFQVLGFPVTVQPAFAILLGIYLLFGIQRQDPLWSIASFSAVVFVSILIHELGHALVGRRFGLRVRGIFIHGIGGHVEILGNRTHRQQLLVSLAGPGAGLLLGLPLLALAFLVDLGPVAGVVLNQAIFVNVIWSIFNLFPMLPLDGGTVLGSGLSIVLGPARGWLVATTLGVVCGAALAAYGLYTDWIFLMLIGGYGVYYSYQARMSLRTA